MPDFKRIIEICNEQMSEKWNKSQRARKAENRWKYLNQMSGIIDVLLQIKRETEEEVRAILKDSAKTIDRVDKLLEKERGGDEVY